MSDTNEPVLPINIATLSTKDLLEMIVQNGTIIAAPQPLDQVSPWGTPVSEPEVAEIADVKPTCRFFGPSEEEVEVLGAEAPPLWPYNRMMPYQACTCPTMNAQGKAACEMPDSQEHCIYYDQSTPVNLVQKLLVRKDSKKRVKMVKSRFDHGLPTYFLSTFDIDDNEVTIPDSEVVEHIVSAVEHAKNTATVASETLNKLIKDFKPSKVVEEEAEVIVVPPSYLREKVA